MPHRLWLHDCCAESPYTSDSPTCVHCGVPGAFVRWDLSSDEATAVYREIFGFPLMGPHRELVQSTLYGLRSVCPRCLTTGVVGTQYEDKWRSCPVCEGTGGAWDAPEDVLQSRYNAIREKYPNGPPEGSLAVALPSGLVPAREHEPAPEPSDPVVELPPEPKPATTPRPRPTDSPPTPNGVRTPTPVDLRRAFIAAEQRLGREWKLKGRDHCRRVSLKSLVSRHVSPVVSCWQVLTPAGSGCRRRLYPLAIVVEAAKALGLQPADLISREFR